jgi:hypothetical protein
MNTKREATMGLIITMIKFGLMKKPDFPLFLVWYKDVKRYTSQYELTNEVEQV